MKRSKFTEQQIAFALKQAELGTPVEEVCRKMGISDATFYNWKKKYGGLTWKRGLGGKNWPTKSMNNTSWQTGRASTAKTYGAIFGENTPAGFANLRLHDLKHTFGRRLRAVGVSLETRKVLLGHKNGNITSHYSAPEIEELIDASNRICETDSRKTHALVMLKEGAA